MSQTTQGTRQPDGTLAIKLQPGHYAKWGRFWNVCSPQNEMFLVPDSKVATHEDKTITVDMEFEVKSRDAVLWRGRLTNGVWREC